MTTYVEYRKPGSDEWHGTETRPGEEWGHALTRLYNHDPVTGKIANNKTIQLSQHFPGGDTWHVQMGYRVRGEGNNISLDPVIVVHVKHSEDEPSDPNLMTADDVAGELGVTPIRVRQLARSLGVGWQSGRDWVFKPADVQTMRERRTQRGRVPKPHQSTVES